MDQINGTPDCCHEQTNRRLTEVSTVTLPTGIQVNKREQCSVCGRSHYTMIVPPVEFGVHGADAG